MAKSKKKSPVKRPAPNNDMAYRYERAYNKMLADALPETRERILDLKNKSDSRDFYPNQFIQQVIALAESDAEL
jgi:hypothetical protein